MEKIAARKMKLLTIAIVLLFMLPGFLEFYKVSALTISSIKAAKELNLGEKSDFYAVRLESKTSKPRLIQSDGTRSVSISSLDENAMAFVSNYPPQPLWITIMSKLFSFIGLILFISVLIKIFIATTSIAKTGLLNARSIKRVRRIAYTLGLTVICFYLSGAIDVFYLRQQLSLSDYTICYPPLPGELTFVVILLLLTEVLRVGFKLQEEQELTV